MSDKTKPTPGPWEAEARRLHRAIARYSGEHYGQVQRDLLAILGWKHKHVAMDGAARGENDECALCGHDLRHEVHMREGDE